jgi:hypothetical protein
LFVSKQKELVQSTEPIPSAGRLTTFRGKFLDIRTDLVCPLRPQVNA